jgi:DNA-binding transcriptional MocR family regulator
MKVVKYVAVADALRERIKTGELPGGEKLVMSTLAKEYDVCPGTICGALSSLAHENLVLINQQDGRWHVGARPRSVLSAPQRAPRLGASGPSDSGTTSSVNLMGLLDLELGTSFQTNANETARRIARELCPTNATEAERAALGQFLDKIANAVKWPRWT